MDLRLLDLLPNEIIQMIFFMMPPIYKIFLNKNNYLRYNYFVDSLIEKGRYNSYIRDIVRYDHIFVFRQIIVKNFDLWLNQQNYVYKTIIYPNYLFFLMNYSNKYNSYKINSILNQQFVLSGLKKKWIKSNRIKNNKWIT